MECVGVKDNASECERIFLDEERYSIELFLVKYESIWNAKTGTLDILISTYLHFLMLPFIKMLTYLN